MHLEVYPVTFRYPKPAAGAVSLIGSFNHWDPKTHRLEQCDGGWRITVFLPAGTYPYAFVDGDREVPDPDPRRALRGPLGVRYSVIVIPETPSPARAA